MKEIRKTTKEMAGQQPMDYVTRQISEIPSTTYLTATMVSILGSMFLLLIGRKWESVFVGLWAPTIMTLGMLAKLFSMSYQERS